MRRTALREFVWVKIEWMVVALVFMVGACQVLPIRTRSAECPLGGFPLYHLLGGKKTRVLGKVSRKDNMHTVLTHGHPPAL